MNQKKNDISPDYNAGRQDVQVEKYVELLTSGYHRIYSFILGLVPNNADAEDIMQETCIVIWKKFSEFEPGTNFVAWAVTIAKYRVLVFRRNRKASCVQLSDATIELLATEQVKTLSKAEEKIETLKCCVKKLSPSDRQFIKMRYEECQSVADIAKQFGKSIYSIYRIAARINNVLLRCVRRQLTNQEAV